jgi:alkaline phosphatase D
MKKASFLLLVILLIFSCRKTQPVFVKPKPLNLNKSLTTIAFGSCNKHNAPQPIWEFVVQNQPDLWIWLGDNIYGDTENMETLKKKYDAQKSNPAYQKLLKFCPIIGIWDDHDYGENDGDKNYPKKEESKELLLEFLDVPNKAAVRKREGAYQTYTFGKKNKKVKILLLDGRYFRDELTKDYSEKNRYQPNESGDVLGEAQWKWLSQELSDTSAALNIIGCGIQMIAKDHGYEKWANFPRARKRLFDLLEEKQPKGVILLSGDRHIAEVSKIKLDGLPYDLYDITSSGLSHSWQTIGEEYNELRVEDKMTGQKNFGIIKIDWNATPLKIKIEIRGLENKLHFEQDIKF